MQFAITPTMKWIHGLVTGFSIGFCLSMIYNQQHEFANIAPKDYNQIPCMLQISDKNSTPSKADDFMLKKQPMKSSTANIAEIFRLSSAANRERFVNVMESLQRERKLTMKQACRSLQRTSPKKCPKPNTSYIFNKQIEINAFYSETYKYAVCYIQKCGFTNWMGAVMVHEGFNTLREFQKGKTLGEKKVKFIKNQRGISSIESDLERKKIWNQSLKIIQVRHPFERIVSAYNDKMIESTSYYNAVSKQINKMYKSKRHDPAERNKANDTTASFEDFVNFLIRSKVKDGHWELYESWCKPCMIDYDYIIKFETIFEDLAYLVLKLNITVSDHANVLMQKWRKQTDENKIKKFFDQIPKHLALALYEHYKKDFLYFGYKLPSWLC